MQEKSMKHVSKIVPLAVMGVLLLMSVFPAFAKQAAQGEEDDYTPDFYAVSSEDATAEDADSTLKVRVMLSNGWTVELRKPKDGGPLVWRVLTPDAELLIPGGESKTSYHYHYKLYANYSYLDIVNLHTRDRQQWVTIHSNGIVSSQYSADHWETYINPQGVVFKRNIFWNAGYINDHGREFACSNEENIRPLGMGGMECSDVFHKLMNGNFKGIADFENFIKQYNALRG